MAVIYVDNRPYEVKDGQNLLEACLSLGFNIPYFCWHPALKSVGACRQCAVKQFRDEKDTRGRIVMSCMTPATPDTRISIEDAEVRAFRAANIGWLMVNHPHDCPVCDEGGECHLQDMTVMTGHNYRQHRFKKRTYRNQYLGPFVHHEMNRCIQCYRCVRFYHDYAGGRDLNVFAAHDRVYFGREQEGTLANEFSGNLVEVCPTGVFTDETLHQHYVRKWDLQSAPSVCNHCGAGCNIIPGERYGTLRRIVNRYNSQVNGYFICDRGRYGYEFVNADERIRRAELRTRVTGSEGDTVEAAVLTDIEALTAATRLMTEATGVVGIGSPRAPLEANYALRCLVGPTSFVAGFSDQERRLVDLVLDIAREGLAPVPTLKQIEESDAVLVLGEDVLNTAPRVALALRQAVRQQPMTTVSDKMRIARWDDGAVRRATAGLKGPLYLATVAETGIDEVASQTYHAAPDDIARLGYAVVEALDVPSAGLQSPLPDEGRPLDGTPSAMRDLARRIAESLLAAERPLVIAGTSLGSETLLRAAADVAWALREKGRAANLYLAVPECNSVGLALLGGGRLEDALAELKSGQADTVVVLENDLYRRAEAPFVDELLTTARQVVVIDSLENGTTAKAHLVLPAATFAEGDGTLVSAEGRMQRFFQVFIALGDMRESWRWLRDLGATTGCADMGLWQSMDDLLGSIAAAYPNLEPLLAVAPPASFRVAGMKVARQPERASGRTAVTAHVDVSEPKPPLDPDAPLAFTMEGLQGPGTPSPLIPRFWAPGWNSWQQSITKFQAEVAGPLIGGDPGIRLFEPREGGQAPYFGQVPPPFAPRAGEWLVVPLYHIFGSDEQSDHSPAIRERMPDPYLGLRPADAERLGLVEGQAVEISMSGRVRRLAVRLMPSLPEGLAGLPAGLPETQGIALPFWSKLTLG